MAPFILWGPRSCSLVGEWRQIADEPDVVVITLVAHRRPEGHGCVVGLDGEEAESTCPQRAQTRFPFQYETPAQPLMSVVWMYGQSVEARSPTIPGRNKGADDVIAIGGQDDRVGIVVPKRIEAFDVIGGGSDLGCQ